MKRHWQYLKYVLRHKWFVLQAGLKLGVPILMLILHDWDKFMPDEWFPYARTFYAPDGSKQYIESAEFAEAWRLHQHRNKHHWQYWLNAGVTPLRYTNILVWDRGTSSIIINGEVFDWDKHGIISVREQMPDVYCREMLADWIGAGRALGSPDTLGWYKMNRDKMKLHPLTREQIEWELFGRQMAADAHIL